MRKLGLTLTVAVFSVALLHAQTFSGPAAGQGARVVIRSGLVEVQHDGGWVPASVGDAVKPGERIRTAAGSSAALEIDPGKVVTLNEQSQVQVGQVVHLEGGSMKVFSASDIQIAAKDMLLESGGQPVDLELGYQADKLNLTVFNGAVRNGSMVIRGGNQDPNVRTYTANGRSTHYNENSVPNPTFYIYPYFMYGNPDPNAGRIVPPVVNNPTNPGYRPTQVVPPMSDPIRVPVQQQK